MDTLADPGVSHFACAFYACIDISHDGYTFLFFAIFRYNYIENAFSAVQALIDRSGVRGIIKNHLTDGEVALLHASADKFRSVISQIKI